MGRMFRGESFYSWYTAFVFMGCYAVGELGHFLIGIVSRPIAQEMKFGEQGCIVNNSDLSYDIQQECKERKNSTECSYLTFNGTSFCEWNYLGSGLLYQLLAGPAFIAIFSVMGLVLGVIGDTYNRVRILFVCVCGYSLMAVLSGVSTQYWQLIILRFGFGAGEAGCTPLTASIIADRFGKRSRALAMSVFNWGIYIGYGLAFTVGNYVTEADILGQGWRWSYFLTGLPGFAMALLLILTVKEPFRREIDDVRNDISRQTIPQSDNQNDDKSLVVQADPETKSISDDDVEPKSKSSNVRGPRKLLKAAKLFVTTPSILMLLLASAVRHTASFCWSYNTQLYFDYYHPGVDIAISMMICSIVGGTIGIATGGIISDLLVTRYGLSTRLWVLVVSQACAAPLAAMVLYLSPPYCFIALVSAYLFAEMWFGILFTVLVEIFPLHLRSTAIALFIFVINNVGSNGQLLVPILKPRFGFRPTLYFTYAGFYGLTEMWYGVVITVFAEVVSPDIRATSVALFAFIISNIGGNLPVIVTPLKYAVGGLRNALYITYPGFYFLSSVFFLFTQILVRRQARKFPASDEDDCEKEDVVLAPSSVTDMEENRGSQL